MEEVKYGDLVFIPSKYQKDIFDKIEHGRGNLMIEASAGCGKTSTIVLALKLIPKDSKALFLAYNRSIRDEIESKIGEYDWKQIKISTFHSLGMAIVNEALGNVEFNDLKYVQHVKEMLANDPQYKVTASKLVNNKYIIYYNNINKLINYSRYYLAFTHKEIERVANKYGIICVADECDVVRSALIWGKENHKVVDYTDLIWLPNVLNINPKKFQFDYIMIDEAQDTTTAQERMVEKCMKRGGRFIIVGDKYQTINTWAGSTEEALENFLKIGNFETAKLPICYRCPKKAIELAQKFSSNIEINPDAIDGEIRYDVDKSMPLDGDMVLCRTMAPLVELLSYYLRINKNAYIKGSDNLRDKYLSLIESTNSKTIDKNFLTTDGLFPKLYEGLLALKETIMKRYNYTEMEAITNSEFYDMWDTILGLKVLSEGIDNVDELTNKIKTIFRREEKGVMLTTIHRAKGLEADNVFILNRSSMPWPLATLPWEKETENNLLFVAHTRCKKTLNFIKEDKKEDFYKKTSLTTIKKELDNVSAKLKLNETYNLSEDDIDTTMPVSAMTLGSEVKPLTPPKKKKKSIYKKLSDLI